MRRASITWAHDAAHDAIVARIEDGEGLVWTAEIRREPYKTHSRLVASLFCPVKGRLLSTNTAASIEEAQNWCYATLGIM